MNNLFFVWTPFQFFIAQNVIMQENLENNILIEGFIGNNKHFYDSYDFMKIDSLWNKIYKIDKLPTYAGLEKKTLLKDIVKLIKYDKYISNIIKENSIGTLYLGEINNHSCQFSAFRYSKQNIRIAFFEEGLANYYTLQISTRGGYLLNKAVSKALDTFFFIPQYHFKYAKYVFDKSLSFKEIPINMRLSILPVYHEQYDKQLYISNILSTKLEAYIRNEYEKMKSFSCDGETILFLSQVIDEINPNATKPLLNVLKNFFSNSIFREKLIVIKFHPRDTENKKIQICNLFKEINLKTYILSDEYTIPVEIYLMKLKFSRIITFFSATFMYAGYIYPKIPIDFLVSDFLEECKKYKIDNKNYEKVVSDVLDMMKNLSITTN